MEIIFRVILFNRHRISNFTLSIIKINKYTINNLLISLNGKVSIIINIKQMPLRQIISNKTNLVQSHTQANQDTQIHIQANKCLNTPIKCLSMKIFPIKAMDTSKTFTSNQNTPNNPDLPLNKVDFKDSRLWAKTKWIFLKIQNGTSPLTTNSFFNLKMNMCLRILIFQIKLPNIKDLNLTLNF